ncbi:MAG: 16S rRNA (cytosine(1402)-N(4))-methyltransferase [Chthoniobacterales bacterium]|nr:16S rRNA (cytosine(1402)-N(4))-methyltransferase [Chthoniobacterales bacterium]
MFECGGCYQQRVFREYGEEPRAGRLAARVVEFRRRKSIRTTRDLLEVLEGSIRWRGGKNPAARIFQALRIEVNDELGALKEALIGAVRVLRPGGRLVVISFHSLEDRIVKHFLQGRERGGEGLRVLTLGPLRPREEEVRRNPRSRSAKMRVGERLGAGEETRERGCEE